jgi:hypothetical protein
VSAIGVLAYRRLGEMGFIFSTHAEKDITTKVRNHPIQQTFILDSANAEAGRRGQSQYREQLIATGYLVSR